MSTAQPEVQLVKRTCRVVKPETRKPCGREYIVVKGSLSQGCPDCCPRLV